MKIHGLCVVKNEADIIEQTLRSAATWCDWIYVLDNGSSDGTWEKVQRLARGLPAKEPGRRLKLPPPVASSTRVHTMRSDNPSLFRSVTMGSG